MPDLTCIVVTPEKTVRETPADFVAATLFDGEIGIAPRHSPFIGRLGCGELRIRLGNQVERLYVEGGFVEVVDDVVSLLTNHAIPAEKIDEVAAQAKLDAALAQTAPTRELRAARELAIAQARGQLLVARRAGSA
jgi:F-type H+-transporting ATPase subunit epsilon